MSVLNENQLMGASGAGGDYEIEQSLRFNDDDGSYLSRTPSSAGNRKTWTWSGWVKRAAITAGSGADQPLFCGVNTASNSHGTLLRFRNDNDKLEFLEYVSGSYQAQYKTAATYRDASAWYHILVSVDTTLSSDKIKMYVNGNQISAFDTSSDYSNDYETAFNNSTLQIIGADYYNGTYPSDKHDGYLAEVNFIDGQALTPDDFGETGDYGEWLPKKYVGTYGTNGFYLDFKDSGSLGNDAAGSNNWTPTNLAATDQMLDSPTNNFATLSPLVVGANGFGSAAYGMSEGNLKGGNFGTGGWSAVASAWSMTSGSGEYYFELGSLSSGGTGQCAVGVHKTDAALASGLLGYTGDVNGYSYASSGTKKNNTSTTYGSTWENGDVIGVAVDMSGSTATITFYKNNVSQGVAFSGITGDLSPAMSSTITGVSVLNFGQDSSFAGNKTAQGNSDANGIGDFYYAPPTGFLALCTKNLPDATVVPSEHFNTVLYTGDGTANRRITGVGFQPDFVWHKARSTTHHNELHDAVRGAGLRLISNGTYAEANHTAQFNSFDVDGFTVSEGNKEYNEASTTYVNWNWKAGGTGVTNTDGTITSTVSANVDAGFSIVSYTGTGANATVGHGLSVAPEMLIVKNRSVVKQWAAGTTGILATQWMQLDGTGPATNADTVWNSTYPSASIINIGTATVTNASSENYIAYAFHSVDGYSKVGSYTGNGSDDGTFVYTGFRPAYVLVKRTDSTGNWVVIDATRNPYNVPEGNLQANTSLAEFDNTRFDIISNGIKMRRGASGDTSASGGTYIYYAVAESPFKHSNAR